MGELQTLLALVVLIYVLSVIVQAVQEIFKAFYSSKAKTMIATITQFMGDHLTLAQVQGALQERGLGITALENFSKDDFRKMLDGVTFTAQQIQAFPNVVGQQAVAAGQTAEQAAAQIVSQLRDHAAAAFEGAMAKFQKSYAAHNKAWVLVFSFIVVIGLNANLIKIYEQLSVNSVLSQAIAGTASSLTTGGTTNQGGTNSAPGTPAPATPAPTAPAQNQPNTQPAATTPKPVTAGIAQPPVTANPNQANPGVTTATAACDLGCVISKNQGSIQTSLKAYPILVRWSKWNDDWGTTSADMFYLFFGLLLMGLLVSLGAPFWNDVLKGLTGINNSLNGGAKKTT